MTFATRLVAYEPDTDTRIGILSEPLSFSASLPWLDGGSMTLSYSQHAKGGDIIARNLAAGFDVEIEASWGGAWQKVDGGRFLYIAREGDQFDQAGVINLTLPSYAWLLKISQVNALDLLEDSGDFAGRRVFTPGTPGGVLRPLLDEWADRHPGKTIPLEWGFTATKDSFGVDWAKSKPTLVYDQGQDTGDILNRLASVDGGLCEWTVRGRTLVVANQGSIGTDVSGTVRLEHGYEIGDAPYRETLEDAAGWILVRGEGMVAATYIDESVPARVATWERNLSASGATTEAEALSLAAGDLELRGRVKGQHTQALLLTDKTRWLPIRDYIPGDVVTGPTPAGRQAMRVQQITLTYDQSGHTGSVVLNDRLVPADLRQARTLRALAQNAAISGTGTVIPATDTRQPAAPGAPTLSDQRILDAVGVWRSRIGASWLAVTQATNGTAMVPVRYELWGQPQASPTQPWRRLTTATGLSAAWEPFDTGSTWRFAVKAVGPNGKVSELGAYTQWTFGPDTTAPPQPSTPTAVSDLGSVTVGWNGLGSAGEQMPADLSRVEVHVSTTSGFAPIATTRRDQFTRSGTVSLTGLAYGVVHYVRLIAYDLSGNASPASDQVAVTPRRAVTDDMANSAIDDIVNASVDAVMPSIAGKNRVTHSSANPTNYAGQIEGDTWFKYSGATIVGWWRAASPTVWAEQTLAEAWLPQVNIGTGTYGLLDGVRILADSIAVSKLLVSDWQNLAVDAAFKAPLGVNWSESAHVLRSVQLTQPNWIRITSQAGANSASYNSLVFDVLPGQEYYLETEAFRYDAYASTNMLGLLLRVRLDDGTEVWPGITGTPAGWGWNEFSGTVTMPANARTAQVLLIAYAGVAGQHYGFRSPKVYRRNSGEVIIDGSMTANKMSATDIFTIRNFAGPLTGNHTRMEPSGFSAWAPNPAAGGAIQPYARFGDGLAFGFDEGSPDARITGKGHASLASASVGELWVDGSTLDEILNPLPKGMVAWTRGQASITGTTTTETALIELRAVLERNRTYVVKVPTLSARSSVAGDVHEIKARIAYDGAPVGTSSTILSLRRYPALVAGVYTMVPGLDLPLNTNGWGAATREARILLTLVRYTGSGTHDVYADATQPITLSVIDEGTYIEPTTTALLRTSVWNCSAMSKQGSTTAITTATLANTQFAHCLFNGNAAQGETGLTVAAALSGATLVKAEVGAYISWYDYDPSSWAPSLGFSAHTNTTPAASLTIGTTADSEDYDPPEFKWTDITSLFTTASRSVAVTSWGSELLKLLNTAAHPVRLRLTYRR